MAREEDTGGPGDVPVVALPARRTGGNARAAGQFGQAHGQLLGNLVRAHNLSRPASLSHRFGTPPCHELAAVLIVPYLLSLSRGDTPCPAWPARAGCSSRQ